MSSPDENNMNHLHCHIYSCDEEFIRDIRSGGARADQAISCLYLRYREPVLRYLHKQVDRNTAYKGVPDDLLHDAFITMIEKLRYEDYPVKTLSGLWMGIGRMVLSNKLKRDVKTILVHDPEAVYQVMDDTERMLVSDTLEEKDWRDQLFNRLGDRCKQVLLHWLDGYSMTEIAGLMGLTSDIMARKLKYHCFKKLKEIIRSGYISGS